MSAPVQLLPLESYRNESRYPFCPGCGHTAILDQLDRALASLQLDPRRVVIVSDIGCSGLSDQYFRTHAFHGLHGRALTYASGLKLARPELHVVVAMGDGGCGIGGAHLLAAARRNIGLTVLVFNNFNFGMTGGQHSATTPLGLRSTTTPAGNLERPLDVCATVAVNGAAYVYRGTSFDAGLFERIAEAIRSDGFALLDIWELCTAYFVPANHYSRAALDATLAEMGLGTGVLHREERPEYARACRAVAEAARSERERSGPEAAPFLRPGFRSGLDRPFRLVLAGSAGGKVRSAARLAGVAALLSGLRATQRDDYPVTVKTGHSLSELILSPEPIDYTGIARPDGLVVVSPEGLAKVRGQLAAMTAAETVFTLPELGRLETRARVVPLDFESAGAPQPRGTRALAALCAGLLSLGVVPLAALQEAARLGERSPEALKAIAAGAAVAVPSRRLTECGGTP